MEGTLRVEESKSEEGERLIALPTSLIDELAEQFTSSPYRSDEDFVFCHPERGTRLDGDWYHERFQEALAEAGVEGHVRAFHDMRHTALTNLAATGASPIAVMATAGHRSMQTTKGYLHLAGITFAEEAAALERRLLGTTASADRIASDETQCDENLEGVCGKAVALGMGMTLEEPVARSADDFDSADGCRSSRGGDVREVHSGDVEQGTGTVNKRAIPECPGNSRATRRGHADRLAPGAEASING